MHRGSSLARNPRTDENEECKRVSSNLSHGPSSSKPSPSLMSTHNPDVVKYPGFTKIWWERALRKEVSRDEWNAWSWVKKHEHPKAFSSAVVYIDHGDGWEASRDVPRNLDLNFPSRANVYNCTFQDLPKTWSKGFYEEVMRPLRQHLQVDDAAAEDIVNAPQRTPAWFLARKHRCTASRVNAFLGGSMNSTREEAMASMAYTSEERHAPTTFAMRRGTMLESQCEKANIMHYIYRSTHSAWHTCANKMTHPPLIDSITVYHEGMAVWKEYPFLGASSDGIAFVKMSNGKWDCFNCEWKCPMKKGGYGGCVPVDYWYQMQQQMGIYWESKRIHKLATSMGISLDMDMVPGWTWRTMFGVFQDRASIQNQFVPYNKGMFMRMVHAAHHVYWTQYAPRVWMLRKGLISPPSMNFVKPLAPSSHDRNRLVDDETEDEDEDEEDMFKEIDALFENIHESVRQLQDIQKDTTENVEEEACDYDEDMSIDDFAEHLF